MSKQDLEHRISIMTDWLKENYPNICEEQKHLDEGGIERGYWHYGYIMALKDMVGYPELKEDVL